MGLYKRGKIWWYKFKFRGEPYRDTTHHTNRNEAAKVEAKVRTDLANGVVGIRKRKIAPTLERFLEDSFIPYIEQQYLETKPRTVQFYKEKCRRLLEFEPLKTARLNAIVEDLETLRTQYVGYRLSSEKRSQGKGKVAFSSVNRELATLRRAMRYARKSNLIDEPPVIEQIPGEEQRRRTFVLTGELENEYFAVAEYPLKHAAILVADLGLRPEEVVSLQKTQVFESHVMLLDSKTPSGVRAVPMTARAWAAIEELWALWPDSPWLFPGRRTGRHLTVWSLDDYHAKLRTKYDWPKQFVLYSFRHTFGTRLAETGASNSAIQELMGHSDIRISQRYIHPTAPHLVLAMRQKEMYDRALRGEVHSDTSEENKRT
jgi:integrase